MTDSLIILSFIIMDTDKLDYKYTKLTINVNEIIGNDFWIYDKITAPMFMMMKDPVKLTSNTNIFVRKGSFKILINLIQYEGEGPALVNIRHGETLQVIEASTDLYASFIVLSRRLVEDMFLHINDMTNLTSIYRQPVVSISKDIVPKFEGLYESMHTVTQDTENPQLLKAIEHCIIAFYYRYAYKCYNLIEGSKDTASRLSDGFIKLVQEKFKTERFLEYYAGELGVTPKHLSRTIKAQTGYSAASWIERFLILESKILLKSTNLTVQQISDSLNFPSQSFFGKYFKKNVGISPKAYRNS